MDAVSLLNDQGYTRIEAARSLGINANLLGRWVKEFNQDDGQALRGNGKLTAGQEEVRKLKAQVKRLEMEKTILKNRLHRVIAHLTRNTIMNFARKVVVHLLEILIPSKNLTQGNLRTRCWWLTIDPV